MFFYYTTNKIKSQSNNKKSYFSLDFFELCAIMIILKNMERYRSGHNGADSKSVCEKSHGGSNPPLSAMRHSTHQKPQNKLFCVFFAICIFGGVIMKKSNFSKRVSYWFDYMMSKGPIAMCVLLLAVTISIVSTIGFISYFISDDGGILYQIWNSLMFTLDPGNLSEVSTDNILYLALMSISSICGLFLTSILIGIIATGVEDKLGNLRKGNSIVQEEDHTLIIGFDNNIFEILRELIEANSNQKKSCIVVLGEQSKDEMEDAISSYISDTKNTKIICRSGTLHEHYALERCSIETCKAVIINIHDDAEIVKILLALSAYVKEKNILNPNLKFIASIENKKYVEAANIAGDGYASIISTKDAIARIISNTCRQHGLAQVLTELFSFDGDEIYYEDVEKLYGKTFKESILSFSNALPIGIFSNNQIYLNPPMDTVIKENDKIILVENDDGAYEYHLPKKVDESKISQRDRVLAKASDNLLILGSNDKLPIILEEFSQYVESNTSVIIVDDDFNDSILSNYENLNVTVCKDDITYELLVDFVNKNCNNILLLNDDSQDPETSDSYTLLRLILLRDIADKTGRHLSITTEMRNVENQRLASQARVDDFVIGSNFSCLIMTQISENPHIMPLIEDLLDESGSELYMKPISDYVNIGVPVDIYTVAESAARKGEVFMGYRINNAIAKTGVIINPMKNQSIVFDESDQIVVVSEN